MAIQFVWQGNEVTWNGIADGQVLLMSRKQTFKVQSSTSNWAYILFLSGCSQGNLDTMQASKAHKGTPPRSTTITRTLFQSL